MENKIVLLKTYITTIVALVILFAIAIGGCVLYYENRIDTLESFIQTRPSEITIVQNVDTSVNDVIAK